MVNDILKNYPEVKGVHPAADAFPYPLDKDFEDLVADIKKRGLVNSIVLSKDGLLIDGRSRLLACHKLGLQPKFTVLDQGRDPWEESWSLNAARRHLTTGQKAAIANAFYDHYAELAKQRMEATQLAGKDKEGNPVISGRGNYPQPKDEPSEKGKARDQAAKKVGIDGSSVSKFRKIEREAPHVADKIKQGTISLNAGYNQVNKPKPKPKPEPPKQEPKPEPKIETPEPKPEEKPEPPPEPEEKPKPRPRSKKVDEKALEPILKKVDAFVDTLPERAMKSTVGNKVSNFLVDFVGELVSSFDEQVRQEVDKQLSEQREVLSTAHKEALEERKIYEKRNQGLMTIMTYDEFKFVRSCLHPDKHPNDVKSKFDKAFHIFNRLQETVNPYTPKPVLRQRGWEDFNPKK